MPQLGINITKIVAILLLAAVADVRDLYARDQVWVIGGGADADSGGVQIEYSANWIIKNLEEYPGDRNLRVYFGDGSHPDKDIVEWSLPADSPDTFQPIARVFGQQIENGQIYRNNNVDDVTGSTQREELIEALTGDFAALDEGDRAFIIYIGHGLGSNVDAGDNTLRLWGESRVTAREFESLLGEIKPTVPTRFLFAQCYSGGFARLIHPRGDDVLELTASNRCGFFASADNQESDGCSPNTLGGDYRDYATSFFAAVTGETRLGENVGAGKDEDGDGKFTLFDAHLSALVHGFSRSVPRSTSETYLEKWQPWYLRWMDSNSTPDNVYYKLFEKVRSNLELPANRRDLNTAINDRLHALRQDSGELEAEAERIEIEIHALQTGIQSELGKRWPEVRHPYTRQFFDFLVQNLDAAQSFIVGHHDYPSLVEFQNRLLQIEADELRTERSMIEIAKLLRLRKLARLHQQFQKTAPAHIKNAYESLRSCETSAL